MLGVAGTAAHFARGGSLVSTGNALIWRLTTTAFVTCDSAGNISYTRAGSFETDKNGYIASTCLALICRGYPVDDTGTLQTGTVTDIQIKTGNIPAGQQQPDFTANFDASDDAIDRTTVPFDATNSSSYTDSYTTTVYDSIRQRTFGMPVLHQTSDNTLGSAITSTVSSRPAFRRRR